MSEADAQSGVLEYWNIGILGFELDSIIPSFRYSKPLLLLQRRD